MRKITSILLGLLVAAPAWTAEFTHRIVFLGDSLTAGYGLDEDQAYPARLQARLKASGLAWEVVNAGVSGDTTRGGLKRLNWLLQSQPDAVFVCLGANDGLRGMDLEFTRKNLDAILTRLKQSGTPAVLAGMRLPTNYGEDYEKRFSELYPTLAKKHGVPLLPFLLKGVGGKAELNQADGVHPNDRGQRLVAETVFKFLQPRLKKMSQKPGRRREAQARVLRTRKDFEWLKK